MQHKGWDLIHSIIWLTHWDLDPFLISTGFDKIISFCHSFTYGDVITESQKKGKTSCFIFVDTCGVFANRNRQPTCKFIIAFENSVRFWACPIQFPSFPPHPPLLLWPLKQRWELTDWLATEETVIKLTTCSTVKSRDSKLKEEKKGENSFILWFFFPSYFFWVIYHSKGFLFHPLKMACYIIYS